jgi:phage tail P2-like protein
MPDLLPPNASELERALAATALELIGGLPVPVRDLWSPERCPAALLPWLAWALSVDVWREGWTEARKRQACASAMRRHRLKGSVAAVRGALADLGYADAVIHEGAPPDVYDGALTYDGSAVYAGGGSWAQYSVEVPGGLTPEEWGAVSDTLATVAPVRCHLAGLVAAPDPASPVYDAAHVYDGAIDYT